MFACCLTLKSNLKSVFKHSALSNTPMDASGPLCSVILHHTEWRNLGSITDLPIGRQSALVSVPYSQVLEQGVLVPVTKSTHSDTNPLLCVFSQ